MFIRMLMLQSLTFGNVDISLLKYECTCVQYESHRMLVSYWFQWVGSCIMLKFRINYLVIFRQKSYFLVIVGSQSHYLMENSVLSSENNGTNKFGWRKLLFIFNTILWKSDFLFKRTTTSRLFNHSSDECFSSVFHSWIHIKCMSHDHLRTCACMCHCNQEA